MNAPQVRVLEDETPGLTIETVNADKDLKSVIKLASFMEEPVTIEIAQAVSDNDPNHTILNVNGTNQPVFF
ncbi:hypothetical protein GM527_13510, partial [Streptococcus pneumoniae]|uniref:hypothetical protein n=1 Tax=Streptococcus pneumoniae TaxID=1313 RepID=UPI0012D75D04